MSDDLGGDVGLKDLPTVGEHGIEVGQLKRCHEQVALPDGELDSVASEPLVAVSSEHALFELRVEIGPIGNRTVAFIRQGDAGGCIEPELSTGQLDAFVERLPTSEKSFATDAIEVRVARDRDGLAKVDEPGEPERAAERAGRVGLVAVRVYVVAGVLVELLDVDQAVRPDHSLGEGRVGRDRLEGRARRILTLNGTVEDGREVLGSGQLPEQRPGDATHELARVIGRERCHGDDRPVAGVERNCGTGRRHEVRMIFFLLGLVQSPIEPPPQLVLDQALDIDVDREVDVVSRDRNQAPVAELPDDLVVGVDLDHAATGHTS